MIRKPENTAIGISWKWEGEALCISKVKPASPAQLAGAEKYLGHSLVQTKLIVKGQFKDTIGKGVREANAALYDPNCRLAERVVLTLEPPPQKRVGKKGQRIAPAPTQNLWRQDPKLPDSGYSAAVTWAGPRSGKWFGRGTNGVGYYDLPVYTAPGAAAVLPLKKEPSSLVGSGIKLRKAPVEPAIPDDPMEGMPEDAEGLSEADLLLGVGGCGDKRKWEEEDTCET